MSHTFLLLFFFLQFIAVVLRVQCHCVLKNLGRWKFIIWTPKLWHLFYSFFRCLPSQCSWSAQGNQELTFTPPYLSGNQLKHFLLLPCHGDEIGQFSGIGRLVQKGVIGNSVEPLWLKLCMYKVHSRPPDWWLLLDECVFSWVVCACALSGVKVVVGSS